MDTRQEAREVLDFWFGPIDDPGHLAPRRQWFEKDPAFDASIGECFAPLIEAAAPEIERTRELRAQGFVRVRVDGKVVDIDSVPKLSKTRKHSVEIVIDRVKVRPDPLHWCVRTHALSSPPGSPDEFRVRCGMRAGDDHSGDAGT